MVWPVSSRWGRGPDGLVVAGLIATVAVVVVPGLRFAYENLPLHVALETAEGLVAALVAVLLLVESGRRVDVAVRPFAVSFAFVAVSNIALSVVPAAVLERRPTGALAWAPVMLRIGAATLQVASCLPSLRRWFARTGFAADLCFAVIPLVAAVGLSRIGVAPVNDRLGPSASRLPALDVAPILTAAQLVLAAALLMAALLVHHSPVADAMPGWFGGGLALLALSRLHYALFPSLVTEYVYSGDVIRGMGHCCLLAAAVGLIARSAAERAELVRLQERARLAAELHDGLVQELTFIRSQTTGRPVVDPVTLAAVAEAATRGLDEARLLVATVDASSATDLGEALRRCADAITVRAGVVADVELCGAAIPADFHDDLIRFVGEAATNAVRHASPSRVRVRVDADQDAVVVEVMNDGTPVDAATARSGFGMATMARRVTAHGGVFELLDEGGWTVARAVLPLGVGGHR